MAITNQNCIREGINIRLNSGNTCYHSIQHLKYSVTSWFMWCWKLVSHPKGRMWIEGIWEWCWGEYLDI